MHGERPSSLELSIDPNEHVNLADRPALEQCASRLGISGEHLRELVARVGTRLTDIESELSRPESLD